MTNSEAIFCERSYIGETNCTDCKYYGTDTCKSRESHKLAIKALEQVSSYERTIVKLTQAIAEAESKDTYEQGYADGWAECLEQRED